ncbi:MAG: RNA-directed DNA polymerase [Gemmataceae bacterium]
MFSVKRSSLDWALLHAEKYGDTDVYPLPFEFSALRHDWTRVAQQLVRQDLHNSEVRPHRRFLSPKARHGFRIVTQLDPIDFLLFTATIREIGSTIEASRVDCAQEVVFSYRFTPLSDGQIFDPMVGFGAFQQSTRAFLDENLNVTHVVVTDIADFYARIYHHRLENALQACGVGDNETKVIMRCLHGWNGSESYGIPVGAAASRVLAEATLIDVDEALLAQQSQFKQFNDDYRIFCTSYTDAYRSLAFLADVLFKAHGLTLQGQKTAILTRDDFTERYLRTFEDRTLNHLGAHFHEFLDSLGLANPYEPIVYSELKPSQQAAVDQLNLAGVFREEIRSDAGPDHGLLKFVLARLGQLGDPCVANEALDKIEELHPILPEIVEYLRLVGPALSESERSGLGRRMLDLLGKSVASCLEFDRGWILSLFVNDSSWGNSSRFFPMLGGLNDQPSRRKLILALGRSDNDIGFRHSGATGLTSRNGPVVL